MTRPEPQARESTHDETDLLLRASRRALVIVLFMVLTFGATVIGRSVWPDSTLAMWPARLPWLLPVLTVLALVTMRSFLHERVWDPKSREVKMLQQDEFRRTNLSRAQRGALIFVLVIQIPLGLLFAHLPAMRAVMAMGTTTITFGMVILIALFLLFDRE